MGKSNMSALDKRKLLRASDLLQAVAKQLNDITDNVVVEKKESTYKTVLVIHMKPAFGNPHDDYIIVDKGMEDEFMKHFSQCCTDWDGYEQFDAFVPNDFNS